MDIFFYKDKNHRKLQVMQINNGKIAGTPQTMQPMQQENSCVQASLINSSSNTI